MKGAELLDVLAWEGLTPRQPEQADAPADGISQAIRVWDVENAANAMLKFEDGSSAFVPLLRDFITHASVGNDGVIGLGMLPTLGHWELGHLLDQPEEANVNALRVAFAAAFETGDFSEFTHERVQALLADTATSLQMDPVMSVYLAYVMIETGMRSSVHEIFEKVPIARKLYDVVMLSGNDHGGQKITDAFSPCPMLTVGWNYLGTRSLMVHSIFSTAHMHLLPSIWTTFDQHITPKLWSAFGQHGVRL